MKSNSELSGSSRNAWLDGHRRFPGERRLPDAATIVPVQSRTRIQTRCHFSSADLTAQRAAKAVRAHRGVENSLCRGRCPEARSASGERFCALRLEHVGQSLLEGDFRCPSEEVSSEP
jgi:hypothetical protein